MDLPHIFSINPSSYSVGSYMKIIILTIISLFVLSAYSCGSAEEEKQEVVGETLYKVNCSLCHGMNGDKSLSGAKKRVESTLNKEQIIEIVTSGRRQMPEFGSKRTAKEIEEIAAFVANFQNTDG